MKDDDVLFIRNGTKGIFINQEVVDKSFPLRSYFPPSTERLT